ncbi:tetratricopeptide repeat protein 13-like [Babylonia areolata]|uniref:tetratricopeptide repeat protein 13-like n=1 Tax=Babylonia areolata TaxID=304850 RepID=UPI003FD1FDE5
MAVSSAISMSILACLVLNAWVLLHCEATNVQIETADGSRHVFEMKTMDKSGAYLLCANCRSYSSGPVPTPAALRFNVRFTPTGEVVSACETHRQDLPEGLCSSQSTDTNGSCPSDDQVCRGRQGHEEVADEIVRRNLLPFPSGDPALDHSVAHAIVEMNGGQWDSAISMLNSLLDRYPENVAAHYARGVASSRKGPENQQLALQAITDFSVCVEKEPSYPEGFERRAEVYIMLNRFKEALSDLKSALTLRPSSRIRFSIGIVHLFLENFVEAEAEFRRNLEEDKGDKGAIYIFSYFHLGLAQYYQGRLRNAIEVFKEVLKIQPNHVEACVSLAQAFKELGNYKAAHTRFDQALALSPNHTLSLQLKGGLLYHSGDPASARTVLQHCVLVDPDNISCQYLLALSTVALGQFYQGIKLSTKVMIKSLPELKISSERVRAQYIREYGRFLHASLDEPVTHLHPEVELDEKTRVSWVQGLPLTLRSQGVYREQPGLQPHITDVRLDPVDWGLQPGARTLLCHADKVGLSMQVSADGFLPNRRLNLAMGLAAVHVAQLAEAKWRSMKGVGKSSERPFSWRELFSVAVQYRQLVDPEQPVLWVDSLPDYHGEEGHREDITLIRGPVASVRVSQYFDLAFKLAKSMLEHYSGAGTVTYPGLAGDIEKASTCQDLLTIARKRQINPNGFLVSTQVPASVAVSGPSSGDDRLDGTVLVLTEDPQGRIVFALSMSSTPARTVAYGAQMDHFLVQLHQEVLRTGVGKLSDLDPVLSAILSLVYYFYNLTPLTRGSSVVAYAVALGLVMSLGRQVSGKIPAGKLLDMEAMLSGAPDAFVAVMRQWMNVKKSSTPVSSLPKVWEVFPTVRSVLEVLVVNTTAVCP